MLGMLIDCTKIDFSIFDCKIDCESYNRL